MQSRESRLAREIFNSGAVMVIALAFATGAFTARAEAKLTGTVTLTGVPATAANGTTFTVTAVTNDGTTASIATKGSCTGSGSGTAVITMTENSGTCTMTATSPATSTYTSAKATQKTTAVTGYTESDLYYFGTDLDVNGDDGRNPNFNGIVFDKAGNIYASTVSDINNGAGAIVELSPIGSGVWNETLVYVFDRGSTSYSGWHPQGTLAMDSKGNIYGTTQYGGGAYNVDTGQYACGAAGGSYGCGTVFELSPNPNGGLWKATDLYDFAVSNANDGLNPVTGVTLNSTSPTVLYGTTGIGGTSSTIDPPGMGTIYELSKAKSGSWNETVLYNFPGNASFESPNGQNPNSTLLLKNGSLYGTTSTGGINTNGDAGIGVIFELSPGSGGWTFNQLYVFCPGNNPSSCPDGLFPGSGTVVMDSKSNLYGTAPGDGSTSYPSTVWELPYSSSTKSYARQVQVLASLGGTTTFPKFGPLLIPYKNSWFTTEYTDENGLNGNGPFCCEQLVELTSGKTGWQVTTVYQWPSFGAGSGLNTLYGFGGQMIVDGSGNFYELAHSGGPSSYGGQALGYGGVLELSPLP